VRGAARADFLAKAKYVGVRSAELSAGMSASPEHAALRAQRIDEDLDRQVEARERLKRRPRSGGSTPRRTRSGTSRRPSRRRASRAPRRPPRAAGRARTARRTTSARSEAKPQPAGADGNRSTKPDEPDPDAQRAQTHKAKAR
jgi:hypothetical protein